MDLQSFRLPGGFNPFLNNPQQISNTSTFSSRAAAEVQDRPPSLEGAARAAAAAANKASAERRKKFVPPPPTSHNIPPGSDQGAVKLLGDLDRMLEKTYRVEREAERLRRTAQKPTARRLG